MESNYLKGSSVQMVHSIELKLGMHIIGHSQTNPIDFREGRMHIFLQECKKEFYYIMTYGVKFFKRLQYPNGAFDWAEIWYVY